MKNLLEVREYEHKGIKVLIRIDRVKKVVSLVEYSDTTGEYVPKAWYFGNRTIGYAKSWVNILEAMRLAVEDGVKELEATDAEVRESMERMLGALADKGSGKK